jgi:DNA-binding transcriptional MerR regulator
MKRTGDHEGLKFADAAREAGVTSAQLQYYIMVGLVEASGESTGGQRRFLDRDIQRIRMIRLLNVTGYPLREVRDIFLAGR